MDGKLEDNEGAGVWAGGGGERITPTGIGHQSICSPDGYRIYVEIFAGILFLRNREKAGSVTPQK